MLYNFQKLTKVVFPPGQNINVNMMPFVIGDKKSIPTALQHYWSLIAKCPVDKNLEGKIGYLSIREGLIESGQTQSRSGIHTEGHYSTAWGGPWGKGGINKHGKYTGIFMASNLENSCRIWNHYVNGTGNGGDCSHLRSTLTDYDAHMMEKNSLYWFHDRCPHEAIPQENSFYRQWFRLVAGPVDVWYSQHSTKNPLGVQPTAMIIKENKFATC